MTYLFRRKGEDATDFIVFWRDPVCCDEPPCDRGGDHYEEMAVERSRVEALLASMIYEEMAVERSRVEALLASMIQERQVYLKDADD